MFCDIIFRCLVIGIGFASMVIAYWRVRWNYNRAVLFSVSKHSILLNSIKITSNFGFWNFELLQTWQVELRIQSNPGWLTITKYWTLSNRYKKPEFQTCSSRNRPNSGPNLEKPNFEPRFINQSWTTNPPDLSKNPKHRTHKLGSTQH